MQLLNTKTLLVIASLLAVVVGLLVRQEQRDIAEKARMAEIEKQDKERWEKVRKYQQTEPTMWGGASAARKKSPW